MWTTSRSRHVICRCCPPNPNKMKVRRMGWLLTLLLNERQVPLSLKQERKIVLSEVVSLWLCVCVCVRACVRACVPACLPACLTACLPACLPVCLSICLCVCLCELRPSELRSCVKVEVTVLGSPSLTVLLASVDVKQQLQGDQRVHAH